MTYDPAWDMPKIRWVQQGSFEAPEIPPDTEPDAEPLVCLPRINQYWLPLVMGALDQLRNPSAWLVADDEAMYNTLNRVSRLRGMLGVGEACMSFAIRFDAGTCELQQSTDGGLTWVEIEGWEGFSSCIPPQTTLQFDGGCTLQESYDAGATFVDVPGWTDNFSNCVQEYTPIIGLPPNPGNQLPSQLACSIAAYLAENVIIGAVGKAVTAIQDDLTLLSFGLNVLDFIPEFVLVRAGADAFSIIYTAVQDGTIADYEDALSDGALLVAIQCAIYSAILSDGFVTPGNFAAVLSNVESVSYTHPDVVTAIANYVEALGATGLAQLSQIAGLESDADCSACSDEWCYGWGDTDNPFDSDWFVLLGRGMFDPILNSWFAVPDGSGDMWLYLCINLDPTRTYTSLHVVTDVPGVQPDFMRFAAGPNATGTILFDTNEAIWDGSMTGIGSMLVSFILPGSTAYSVTHAEMKGPDSTDNPYGANNC